MGGTTPRPLPGLERCSQPVCGSRGADDQPRATRRPPTNGARDQGAGSGPRSSAHALPVPPVACNRGSRRSRLRGLDSCNFTLPFYPAGWSWGSPRLLVGPRRSSPARARRGARPRLLPLGNVSLGLAVVYAVVATAWLAATWNRSKEGLYPLARSGPRTAGHQALMLPAALLPVRRAAAGAPCLVRPESSWRGVAATVSGATLPLSRRRAVGGSPVPKMTLRARRPCARRRAHGPAPRFLLAAAGRCARGSSARGGARRLACRRARRAAIARPARGRRERCAGHRRNLALLRRGLGQARGPAPLNSTPAKEVATVLRTIEQKIESLFEAAFGRAFPRNVQP